MAVSDQRDGSSAGAEPLLAHVDYGKHPLHDSSQRPLHVIVIGAGPSGIAMLRRLKSLPNVSFHCFEKNREVGGTWLETRYPGAACDVASHAYQYTFESKKDWSRHFAPAEEIGNYFISVATKHELHSYITFNSRVTGAQWDERVSKWKIKVADVDGAGPHLKPPVHEHEADLFINAGGILNDWKWPDIESLHRFTGDLVHTAAWDTKLDLSNKRVAVVGSGASSIQVVPTIQPACKALDVYVRSPTYILPTVGFGVESSAYNEIYTQAQIDKFTIDTHGYRQFRKVIEQQMNENFVASLKNSQQQLDGRVWAEKQMRECIKSPKLQMKLIPSWELGCRRITPGLPYLKAVQQSNVDLIREGILEVTETGIQTADGQLHETDVIICATGFNTSFDRYEIRGRGGVSISDLWKHRGPEAYMGTTIAGLPNYFSEKSPFTLFTEDLTHQVLLGPNCPIANGSLIPCIESSVDYIAQAIIKMGRDQIKTLQVKDDRQRAFNDYVQTVHQDLVWTGSCNSWYKDRITGRVTAVWPGSSIHFMEMLETPRWEDFDIEYTNPNPYMFMGNGISQREDKCQDLAYYLDKTMD